MNKPAVIIVALALLPWHPAVAEVSGRITLASEYIFRGKALSDGNPALQAGIDYGHDSGFFLGAWGSTVDIVSPSGRRDVELDYYVGWHFSGESRIGAALSVTRYTYPGQTGSFDYDYTEVSATMTYDGRYSLEFGYTDDLYGFGVGSGHVELRIDWPLRNAWVVSGGLGVNDYSNLGSSRYTFGDLDISSRFGYLTVDLRWYDNERPTGFQGQVSAGSRLVGALSVGF